MERLGSHWGETWRQLLDWWGAGMRNEIWILVGGGGGDVCQSAQSGIICDGKNLEISHCQQRVGEWIIFTKPVGLYIKKNFFNSLQTWNSSLKKKDTGVYIWPREWHVQMPWVRKFSQWGRKWRSGFCPAGYPMTSLFEYLLLAAPEIMGKALGKALWESWVSAGG